MIATHMPDGSPAGPYDDEVAEAPYDPIADYIEARKDLESAHEGLGRALIALRHAVYCDYDFSRGGFRIRAFAPSPSEIFIVHTDALSVIQVQGPIPPSLIGPVWLDANLVCQGRYDEWCRRHGGF